MIDARERKKWVVRSSVSETVDGYKRMVISRWLLRLCLYKLQVGGRHANICWTDGDWVLIVGAGCSDPDVVPESHISTPPKIGLLSGPSRRTISAQHRAIR